MCFGCSGGKRGNPQAGAGFFCEFSPTKSLEGSLSPKRAL